eukprot:145911_1
MAKFVLYSLICVNIAAAQSPTPSPTSSIYSCTTDNQCMSTYMKCAEDEDCQVDCTAPNACRFATIQAPMNASLTINCSSSTIHAPSCGGSTIHAPVNGNLNISCNSLESCSSQQIYAPAMATGHLSLQCVYETSCRYLSVIGSFGGLDVLCSGREACRQITLAGPMNGDFNLEVLGGGDGIIRYGVIDASNMITGSLNAQFTGSRENYPWEFDIKCPGNSNECNIICSSSHSCAKMTVRAQNRTKLSIIASGSNALRSARVFCPFQSGTCWIIASGSAMGIISDLIVYSVDGLASPLVDLQCNYTVNVSNCYSESLPPRIGCRSDLAIVSEIYLNSGSDDWKHVYYDNETRICNDNTQDGWYGKRFETYMRGVNIFCLDGAHCIIYCGSFYSCLGNTIYGPTTGDLSLECIGRAACPSVTVTGPTTGDLNMTCWSVAGAHGETCKSATIIAPIEGDFNFKCVGGSSYTFYLGVLDASSMIAGSLHVEFSGSANYPFTIRCPGHSNECNIICSSSHSCAKMTVRAQNRTKLSIIASGSNALRSARVFCPFQSGTCWIIASGSAMGIISDLIVYSVDGLASPLLDLQCNYAANVSNCYSESQPPRIGCRSGFDIMSEIYLNSGTDDWKHVYNDNETLICNDNMQDGWYGKRFETYMSRLDGTVNVFCLDGADCIVYCDSQDCMNSIIYGPMTGDLSLECIGRTSCYSVTVTGPTTGDLNITCGPGTSACLFTTMTGPIYGDFNFKMIMGASVLHSSQGVDASNMITGSLNAQITGGRTDDYPFTIKCPGNSNECNILCTSLHACGKMTVLSLNDSQIAIKATGDKALHQANIYCPRNGSCVVDAISAGDTDILSQISIYHPHSFDNFQLRCNYTNTTECYTDTTRPTLICLPNDHRSCTVELQTSTLDEWECINSTRVFSTLCDPTTSPTKYPTTTPTQNPTKTPTDMTTTPTQNPTKTPTDMTTTPTQNPTKTPTRDPTRDPTRYDHNSDSKSRSNACSDIFTNH